MFFSDIERGRPARVSKRQMLPSRTASQREEFAKNART